jgi:putative ABC transport system permease protein
MMNITKTLNKRGQHNWTKIVCLAVGLATGIVLIGKAGFEQSWDSFFASSHRTYVVCEDIVSEGEFKHYPQTAGAIAPAFHRYCPQVEAATRYTTVAWSMPLVTDDNKRIRVNYALVDSCFFDVFPFRIVAGDAKQTLSRVDYCLIPQSIAEKLGGDVLGKKVYYNQRGGWALTIGGVYEDIPLNSKLHGIEVMVSMPTITKITFDGRDNWVGNDRYESYVRLAEGVGPDDLKPQINKMEQENLPLEELEKAGLELGFSLQPLEDYHAKDEGTRRMTWIMSILAAVLIGCAVMNYLLLVIGGIRQRAREMAVHQCYGAETRHIYQRIMLESGMLLLLSMLLAALLLLAAKDLVEELTGAPLLTLLTTGNNISMVVTTCVVVLLITGLVPSYIYTHIPLAAAFKSYHQSHRLWKLLLLGLQFASVTFLITLLMVVGRQYQRMVNDDPGYDYSTLGSIFLDGVSVEQRQLVIDELSKLSSVKGITMAYANLTETQSGDNIYLPNDEHEYMNIADLYYVGDGYFDVMGIPVVSGRTFTEQTDTLREVMVSRRFEERMKEMAGWDHAVGQQIICTSYEGPYTIVGVFEDPRIGSITLPDMRPSVCYYNRHPDRMRYILVRFQDMQGLEAANKRVKELVTDNPDICITPYNQMIVSLYDDAQRFRTTVMIGGLVALVIALIGLVGYLAAEIGRRQKEIAVRKVNGATITDVLRLFLIDLLRVALPAALIGAVGAWYIAELWLEQFCEKTPLSLPLFVGGALAVIAIILGVVCLGCYRVASSNPVDYLKNE